MSRMVRAEGASACPFCGGTEVYVEEYEHHPGAVRWRVLCAGCMAGIDTGTRQSAGAAVQDWNRRAGRTCRNVCEWNIDTFHFTCSECGAEIAGDDWGDSPIFIGDYHGRLNYCPHCGARVIKEDSDGRF